MQFEVGGKIGKVTKKWLYRAPEELHVGGLGTCPQGNFEIIVELFPEMALP